MSKNIAINNSKNVQWTPESYSVRNKVNENVASEMLVHNGVVYFSNVQYLYKQVCTVNVRGLILLDILESTTINTNNCDK